MNQQEVYQKAFDRRLDEKLAQVEASPEWAQTPAFPQAVAVQTPGESTTDLDNMNRAESQRRARAVNNQGPAIRPNPKGTLGMADIPDVGPMQWVDRGKQLREADRPKPSLSDRLLMGQQRAPAPSKAMLDLVDRYSVLRNSSTPDESFKTLQNPEHNVPEAQMQQLKKLIDTGVITAGGPTGPAKQASVRWNTSAECAPDDVGDVIEQLIAPVAGERTPAYAKAFDRRLMQKITGDKSASYRQETLAALPSTALLAAVTPAGVGARAARIGSSAGALMTPTWGDEELEEANNTPERAFVPGVGGYRYWKRLGTAANRPDSPANAKNNLRSEIVGKSTAPALAALTSALASKGINHNFGTDIEGSHAAIAGGGAALTIGGLASLIEFLRKRQRDAGEQREYDESHNSVLKNLVIPGAANVNAIRRLRSTSPDKEKEAAVKYVDTFARRVTEKTAGVDPRITWPMALAAMGAGKSYVFDGLLGEDYKKATWKSHLKKALKGALWGGAIGYGHHALNRGTDKAQELYDQGKQHIGIQGE